jgi:hypothetical protein
MMLTLSKATIAAGLAIGLCSTAFANTSNQQQYYVQFGFNNHMGTGSAGAAIGIDYKNFGADIGLSIGENKNDTASVNQFTTSGEVYYQFSTKNTLTYLAGLNFDHTKNTGDLTAMGAYKSSTDWGPFLGIRFKINKDVFGAATINVASFQQNNVQGGEINSSDSYMHRGAVYLGYNF